MDGTTYDLFRIPDDGVAGRDLFNADAPLYLMMAVCDKSEHREKSIQQGDAIMMANIALVALFIFYSIVSAGSVYLNLFCDDKEEF